MNLPILDRSAWSKKIDELEKPWQANYLAMYSSQWQGIVIDPALMILPVDDHLVHRADGVFDAAPVKNGSVYSLEAHLTRLARSAERIGLEPPPEFEHIEDIMKAVLRAGGEQDCLIRTIMSRGPGGFSTNPFECPQSHLYIIAHKTAGIPDESYENGVAIISSSVPVKPSFFAQVKSCDYLLNVLIKKQAKEAGVDFAVTWDDNGNLAEGSTENIVLVSPDKELLVPEPDRILKGITLTRTMELAEDLIKEGILRSVKTIGIDWETAMTCSEAILLGTSLSALPVVKWNDIRIGDGRPGPVARRLRELILDDMTSNDDLLTPMFGCESTF